MDEIAGTSPKEKEVCVATRQSHLPRTAPSGSTEPKRTVGTEAAGIDDQVGAIRVQARRLLAVLARLPRLLGLALVGLYQVLISPLLPPGVCRFYPSCSRYAFTAISRHGLVWGGWLAVRRLVRCHPWNPGGVDDVPEHDWRGRPHRCQDAHPDPAGSTG